MANLGCLLVCTFGNFPAPVLVAAHTVNNLDLGDEPEDEGYESDLKRTAFLVPWRSLEKNYGHKHRLFLYLMTRYKNFLN